MIHAETTSTLASFPTVGVLPRNPHVEPVLRQDLARGLGLPCYVFNCSDQMNYRTMADIFKGLTQV